MTNLNSLSQTELTQLKNSVEEEIRMLERTAINATFQISNYEERIGSVRARLAKREADLVSAEAVLQSMQASGASEGILAEYTKERDKAQLEKQLAEIDAQETAYDDLSLRERKQEQTNARIADFQQWITEIDAALAALQGV